MSQELAPVFVNDARIRLDGNPKPQVSMIVQKAGKAPAMCTVFRLASQKDEEGPELKLEDFIDRVTEANPVYLKLLEREASIGATTGGGVTPPAKAGPAERFGQTPSNVPIQGSRSPSPPGRPPSPPGRGGEAGGLERRGPDSGAERRKSTMETGAESTEPAVQRDETKS